MKIIDGSFTHSAAFSLILFMSIHAAALPEPKVKWSLDLKSGMDASPVAYPSQKPNSIVLGQSGRVARILGNGNLLFDRAFGPEHGRGGIYDPSVADLDGDGQEELIVGHDAGYVAAQKLYRPLNRGSTSSTTKPRPKKHLSSLFTLFEGLGKKPL